MKIEEALWCEKWRPRTVSETILPKALKEKFQSFVDQKKIPNLLLCGGSGVGKTTVARAMLEELGCDYIVINGSMEGGIETLRNQVQRFASSVSLEGGRKYVILDEADYLTHAMQPALRNFMEEFSINCGFILTCNFKNRIIKALHSRCSVIEFVIPNDEKTELAKQFLMMTAQIGTPQAYAQHRLGLEGNIVDSMTLTRCLNSVKAYLFPKFISRRILKRVPKMSIKRHFIRFLIYSLGVVFGV